MNENKNNSNEKFFLINDFNLQNKNSPFESIEKRSCKITEKIYNKMMKDKNTKMERNERRKKIIDEQEKIQLKIQNKIREEKIINKLK